MSILAFPFTAANADGPVSPLTNERRPRLVVVVVVMTRAFTFHHHHHHLLVIVVVSLILCLESVLGHEGHQYRLPQSNQVKPNIPSLADGVVMDGDDCYSSSPGPHKEHHRLLIFSQVMLQQPAQHLWKRRRCIQYHRSILPCHPAL